MLDSITSGLVGVSSRDFFQSTLREAVVINWPRFLQRPPPNICDGKKIVQNYSRFLTTFDFDREYRRNRSTYQKSEKLLIILTTAGPIVRHRGQWIIISSCQSAATSEIVQESSAKLTNQRVSYAFTSSPLNFHACHILPASKFQYSYSCILLIFYRHQ